MSSATEANASGEAKYGVASRIVMLLKFGQSLDSILASMQMSREVYESQYAPTVKTIQQSTPPA